LVTGEFVAAAWAKALPLAGAAIVGDVPIKPTPMIMRAAIIVIFIVISCSVSPAPNFNPGGTKPPFIVRRIFPLINYNVRQREGFMSGAGTMRATCRCGKEIE
jgi:hypothetical protein